MRRAPPLSDPFLAPHADASTTTCGAPPPTAEVPAHPRITQALDEALNTADQAVAHMAHGLDLLRQEMPEDQQNEPLFFLLEALDMLRDRCEDAIQKAWRSVGMQGISS